MRVQHLTTDEILAIHGRLIDRFGGNEGLRDPGLIESALYRPQSGYYEDLATMAAALFESLIMNHPFVDGNKRVAFFATDVFLRINGYYLDINDDEAHAFLIGLIEQNRCDCQNLLPWIQTSIARSP